MARKRGKRMEQAYYEKLERSLPEREGIPSGAVAAFLDRVQKEGLTLHSLLLLRNGKVITEGYWFPYTPVFPHHIYSFSKSFVSAAVGLAVAEGRLRLDDRVGDFFPQKSPKADPKTCSVTVRQLLTMSSGNPANEVLAVTEGDWADRFLNAAPQFEPGSAFHYNSINTYMLARILRAVTGEGLCDYLRPRLFAPLGFGEVKWSTCPMGVEAGGWGLHLCTEDLAKFMQMTLQHGRWKGRQVLPEDWVREATSTQIDNSVTAKGEVELADNRAGYGYQFWMCRTPGIYRADGAFAQYGVVWPEKNLVAVTTCGQGPPDKVLDALWDTLITPLQKNDGMPGWRPEKEPSPAAARLACRLRALSLVPEGGKSHSPLEEKISGRRYRFQQNLDSVMPLVPRAFDRLFLIGVRWASFEFGKKGCVFTWREGSYLNAVGVELYGGAAYSNINIGGHSYRVACSGRWTAPFHLEVRFYFVNTPHMRLLQFRFFADANAVVLRFDEVPTLKDSLAFVFDMKIATIPFEKRVLHFTDKMALPVIGITRGFEGKIPGFGGARAPGQENGE